MAIASEGARTELRIDGVLDVTAVRLITALLDELPYAEVRIDLGRVREFHEFAVALLAEAMAARRAPTVAIGLGERHVDLMRHLGVACTGAETPATGGELA